jgi:hypothetical protein
MAVMRLGKLDIVEPRGDQRLSYDCAARMTTAAELR